MRVCPKCGHSYFRGEFCANCGARLETSSTLPLPLLIAGGAVLAVAILLVLFSLALSLLAAGGAFRAPSLMNVTAGGPLSCNDTLRYAIRRSGEDGSPIQSGTVTAYGNGALLERLVTDQNGRLESEIPLPRSWCGRKVALSFEYGGDAFHANASYQADLLVRIPTSLLISAPDSAMNGTFVTLNATLRSMTDGSPVAFRNISIAGTDARTDGSGNAQASVAFEGTGYQSVSASFAGDQSYLPSVSGLKTVLIVPQSCTDGTLLGECSAQAGYFCGSGRSLAFDCARCGCPSGLACYAGSCVSEEQRTASVISALQDSVVLVKHSYAQGSGVVIAQGGGKTVILTNRHVVKDALGVSDVTITTNGQEKATASDIRIAPHDMDLAVIIVSGTYGKPASLNYSDVPFKGEDVVALGSPLGLQGSVSKGIVSNFVNDSTSTGYVHTLVQTDAAVNPGNSGGGLFLLGSGDLIGLNTWKYVNTTGLNFAISISEFGKLPPYQEWEGFAAVLRCDDGTPYGSCSQGQQGQFCSNGDLVNNCRFCGCSQGYICLFNDKCFYCPNGNVFTDNAGRALCCPSGWSGWAGSPPFCCPPGTSGTDQGTCQ